MRLMVEGHDYGDYRWFLDGDPLPEHMALSDIAQQWLSKWPDHMVTRQEIIDLAKATGQYPFGDAIDLTINGHHLTAEREPEYNFGGFEELDEEEEARLEAEEAEEDAIQEARYRAEAIKQEEEQRTLMIVFAILLALLMVWGVSQEPTPGQEDCYLEYGGYGQAYTVCD